MLSSLLALAVVVAFSMLIYISLFFTISPIGSRIIVAVFSDFLAGAILPLPFFPDPIRRVLELLPFAAMHNMPLRIYSGNIIGIDAVYGIALQLFWLAVLLICGRLFMAKALKKVIVQGG